MVIALIQNKIRDIAQAMRIRPTLLILLLCVWGITFMYSLILYLLKTNGIPIFNWNAIETSIFMGVILSVTFWAMLWRIIRVNDVICKTFYNEFKMLNGREPNVAELERLNKVCIKGNFVSRLKQITQIGYLSLFRFMMVLMIASILLKVCYEWLVNEQESPFYYFLFVNIPWVISLFVGFNVIYNDFIVLESLKQAFYGYYFITNKEVLKTPNVETFFQILTDMEKICCQKKYSTNLRNKQIADELHISESTVKTHINNMNNKWKQFAQNNALNVSLREYLTQTSTHLHPD